MSMLNIFSRFKSIFTIGQDMVPHRIYGGLVAQSRKTAFYTKFAIPDTVMGRYDMLGLHVFLLTNRLKNTDCEGNDECRVLSQKIFDLFVIDLERGLREIGFADTSVKKRKKKLVHSYYALIDEFDSAIEQRDTNEIATAIARRYYAASKSGHKEQLSAKLAGYILLVATELGAQDIQTCFVGNIAWPEIPGEKA